MLNKLKNIDWTKIAFFILALPFLISGLIVLLEMKKDIGMILITKGVMLLGFGFSRNGTKKHQQRLEKKIDEVKKDQELHIINLQKRIDKVETRQEIREYNEKKSKKGVR